LGRDDRFRRGASQQQATPLATKHSSGSGSKRLTPDFSFRPRALVRHQKSLTLQINGKEA
jgi:hypothetical protein